MPQLSTRQQDGTRRLMLTSEQFGIVRDSLSNFQSKSRADSVILSDLGGAAISFVGEITAERAPLIAAVVAANYSAASELAKLVGEGDHFLSHFHEGNRSSLTVTAVGSFYLLAAIYGKNTTLGLVRSLGIRTAEVLRVLLEQREDEPPSNGTATQEQ